MYQIIIIIIIKWQTKNYTLGTCITVHEKYIINLIITTMRIHSPIYIKNLISTVIDIWAF